MSDYETPNLNMKHPKPEDDGRNELIVDYENSYESVEDILADFKTQQIPVVEVDEPTIEFGSIPMPVEPAVLQDELPENMVYPDDDAEDSFDEEDEAEDAALGDVKKKQSVSKNKDEPKEKNKSKRKRKKHRKKHPLLRFLVFLLVLFGLYKFAMSDFFTVKNIIVEGNHYYTVSQIVDMAQIPTGYNLFETDTSAGKDVLLADPYITLVEIKREPVDTIRITVTEREEYAAVPYGEEYILIDKTGMVLRITDKEPPLPLLIGMTIIEMTPGKPLAVEQSYLLTSTLELLGVMDENDLYFKRVNFSTVVVKAYIYDDLYCEGTPTNITDSMADVRSLVASLYEEGTTRGIIKVGKPGVLSFDPQIE